MGRLFNKYAVAGLLGVIAVFFYVQALLPQPDNARFDAEAMATAIGLVFLSVFGAVLCSAAFAQLCFAKAADLGILHDERPALMGGLFFTAIYGACAAIAKFDALSDASPNEDPSAWIYRSWGQDGNCATSYDVRRGAREGELVVAVSGEEDVRRLVGRPTRDIVETEKGIFRRHQADGSMTTSERGMEGVRLQPCAP